MKNTPEDIVWLNEEALKGAPSTVGWATRGNIIQGIPRGDAAPLWWSNEIGNKDFTTSKWWQAITPWFVLFEGESNTNLNFRLKVYDIEMWVLRCDDSLDRTKGKWELVVSKPQPTWCSYYDHRIAEPFGNAQFRVGDDGINEYAWRPNDACIHGGTPIVSYDCKNIMGCVVRIKAGIVKDDPNGPDLDDCSVLFQTGADYYPLEGHTVTDGHLAPCNYLPAAGGNGFQKLTTTPREFFFSNVTDDPGDVEKWNPYCQGGGRTWITKDEYRANPAPIYEYIPDLNLTPNELLLGLFNHHNRTKLTLDDIKFGLPKDSSTSGYDTNNRITLNESSLTIPWAALNYNRMDLARLFEIVGLEINGSYLLPVLDWDGVVKHLRDNYGMNINEGFTLKKEQDDIYLVATDDNVSYKGKFLFTKLATVDERIALKQLNGFDLLKLKR